MVIDAAAPIKRRCKSYSDLQAALDEESEQVLDFLQNHKQSPKLDLFNEDNLKIKPDAQSNFERRSSSSNLFDDGRVAKLPPLPSARRNSHGSTPTSNSSISLNTHATPIIGSASSRRYSSASENCRVEMDESENEQGSDYQYSDEDFDDEDEDEFDDGIDHLNAKTKALSVSDRPQRSNAKKPNQIPKISKPISGSHLPAVHPHNAFVTNQIHSPENSDNESSRKFHSTKPLSFTVTEPEHNTNRVTSVLSRGNIAEVQEQARRIRFYLIAIDLSPESIYALEWTIGTVLRDGDTLFIVDCLESNEAEKKSETQLKEDRVKHLNKIIDRLKLLLRGTRLQCICIIEVIHHPTTKHLIIEMIDYLEPNMVILGSRGRSSLSSTLLGSFSNYIVSKSSVPVMVARKKLRKGKHRYRAEVIRSRMIKNLANAIVDEKGPMVQKRAVWSPFK